MKANELQLALKRFFEEDNPYTCILINGTWGIGKTYEVKKALKQIEKKIYLSLFGLKSLDDLYSDLVVQRLGFEKIGRAFSKSIVKELPYIGKLASLVTPRNVLSGLASTGMLKDYYLIVDDIERVGSEFSFEEFLGFVESMQEQNIRIILIANRDKIREVNREVFDSYNEKIVDKEYFIDNVADDIMQNNNRYNHELIRTYIEEHGITNIRTLEKAQNFFEEVYALIKCITQDDIKEQIRSICYAIVFEDIEQFYRKRIEKEISEEKKGNYDYASLIINDLGQILMFHYLDSTYSLDLVNSIIDNYQNNTIFDLELLKIQYSESRRQKEQELYYKSSKEVQNMVAENEAEIRETDLNIMQLISKSNSTIIWTEILGESSVELLNAIEIRARDIISRTVDTSETLDNQLIDTFRYHLESKELAEVCNRINTYIAEEYFKLLFTEIQGFAEVNKYDYVYTKLKIVDDQIYAHSGIIKQYLPLLLNDSFLLTGNVSEDKVLSWRRIARIVSKIDHEGLMEFIEQKNIEYASDKMFIHRTKVSLRQ